MRPSESTGGREWLTNFRPEDRPTATRLLDSLHVVGETTLRSRLSELVAAVAHQAIEPVACYAVTDVGAIGRSVQQVPPPLGPPDSSAIVANMLRSLSLASGKAIRFNPNMNQLRSLRIRTVLLVDDYSGSGGQAARYVRAWLSSRTVQSWISYRRLTLRYVSYACSWSARRELESIDRLSAIHRVWSGLNFDAAPWTDEERTQIRELCQSYAGPKTLALGFKESEGLFVSQHTVPNNLPAILYQPFGPRKTPWQPMFAHRQMTPEQCDEIGDHTPEADVDAIMVSYRRRPLSESLTGATREVLALLAVLEAGLRHDDQLGAALAMPALRPGRLLLAAQRLGFCDERRRLTDAGRRELSAAKATRPVTRFGVTESDAPYYPQYRIPSRARGSGTV